MASRTVRAVTKNTDDLKPLFSGEIITTVYIFSNKTSFCIGKTYPFVILL